MKSFQFQTLRSNATAVACDVLHRLYLHGGSGGGGDWSESSVGIDLLLRHFCSLPDRALPALLRLL